MEPVQAAAAARGSSQVRAGYRRTAAALLAGGVLVLATACGPDDTSKAGGSGGSSGGPAASASPKLSAAVLSVSPKDGTDDVAPSGAVKVSVADGKLTQVTVADKDGNKVTGAIAADGSSWTPSGPLAVGMLYKVNAQAVDAAGLQSALDSSFTTLTPAKTVAVNDNVTTGTTYGVGMIVSVNFSKDVSNKDDVLKGITFEASDGTQVKGHWFSSRRLDFRPEQYWKSGTNVKIHSAGRHRGGHRRLRPQEQRRGVHGRPLADLHGRRLQ